MVVDTSALVAFILDEEDADTYEAALVRSPRTMMSVGSYIETAIVLQGKGRGADVLLDSTLDRLGIELVAVTEEHGRIAQHAYRQYGRGSGSPAKLNFGDCFAYALAKALDTPLLFKGADFAATDVKRA
jgi:ribonuclease VapC